MKTTREHDITLAFVIVFVAVGMLAYFATNMLTSSKASAQNSLTKIKNCYRRCTYVPDDAVKPVSCGSFESRIQNSTCKACLNNCIVSVSSGGGGGGGGGSSSSQSNSSLSISSSSSSSRSSSSRSSYSSHCYGDDCIPKSSSSRSSSSRSSSSISPL